MHLAPGFEFELLHLDRHSGARLSRLRTPRGEIDLPAFMPVGTCGTVKGLTCDLVRSTGAQILLGNTYHLALRPGAELIAELGGLHRFMDWSGPILTDSGGFQIFSLAQMTRITEEQATFRSHLDGSLFELSPERSVQIQEQLGSDIAMVLDQVVGLPAPHSLLAEAVDRSTRWAERCRQAQRRSGQIQFAIVQGGLDPGLRERSARQLLALDFPGYAVGGLSVGEEPAAMYETIEVACRFLPSEKPRYLMGVGTPGDLLEGIRRGIDMFDCVMPTRNGRNACAFTDQGQIKIRNSLYRRDPRPLQAEVQTAHSHLSRAYLRHLFLAGEMLGPILLSLHNLAYYQRLMRQARAAIAADCFLDFLAERKAGWDRGPAGHSADDSSDDSVIDSAPPLPVDLDR